MKITLNPDAEVVRMVKEGLRRTGGYCPCRTEKKDEYKCMCREFGSRLKIRTSRVIATACFTTNHRRKNNNG